MAEFIDITFPVSEKLPKWPESIGYEASWHLKMEKGATNNLSSIVTDCHFGTHLDAPLHFVKEGKSIDQLDLKKLIGETHVVAIRGIKSITAEDLEKVVPRDCKRLLLKTDNQVYWENSFSEFQKDFCSIDESGAKWIVDRGIELVGIDYLSIQRFYDGPETHQILLQAEVIIVESLNLQHVQPGKYELICLPIKLKDLEGAPVRAILKKIE
jgi:arylformamidase